MQWDYEAVTNPKFEVYTDEAGEFRFRLKAKNGEIIAVGEGYKTKASCLNGIDSIRRNAPEASVEKVESWTCRLGHGGRFWKERRSFYEHVFSGGWGHCAFLSGR